MKRILITLMTVVSAISFSQTVTVTESDKLVDKIQRTGGLITLELDKKMVLDLWKKQLKEYGKVSKDGNVITVEQAQMPTITSSAVKIYTVIESSGNHSCQVWMAIDAGDAFVTKTHTKWSALDKIMHDFGISAYTDDINAQIADAESALEKASKTYDKTVKDGDKLKTDMDRNIQRKADLEQQLKDNADEKLQLESDITANTKEQESTSQEVDKMKEALDLVKAKLNGVH